MSLLDNKIVFKTIIIKLSDREGGRCSCITHHGARLNCFNSEAVMFNDNFEKYQSYFVKNSSIKLVAHSVTNKEIGLFVYLRSNYYIKSIIYL